MLKIAERDPALFKSQLKTIVLFAIILQIHLWVNNLEKDVIQTGDVAGGMT